MHIDESSMPFGHPAQRIEQLYSEIAGRTASSQSSPGAFASALGTALAGTSSTVGSPAIGANGDGAAPTALYGRLPATPAIAAGSGLSGVVSGVGGASSLRVASPAAGSALIAPSVARVQPAFAPSVVRPVSAVPAPSGAASVRVAAAAGEVGVQEFPLGSNDGPRIAMYRTSTAGSAVGPWCAYFTSWVAKQAGTPLGPDGKGIGWVPAMKDWLSSEGRWVAGGTGGRPGDLVFFDGNHDGTLDHIGIVESVGSDGTIHTIEGNSSDGVRRRDRQPSEIAGYGLLP